MEKYHALIKNWKHVIRNNTKANVQFVIVGKNTSKEYLGLYKINLYQPLTKNEWLYFNVNDDNAIFLTDEEMESLVEYLLEPIDYLEYIERGDKY